MPTFAKNSSAFSSDAADFAHAVGIAQHLEEALLRLRIVEPVQRVAEAVLRDVHADHPRRDRLDGVRLVEDHEVIRKKVAALVFVLLRDAAEAEEKKRVVHHHEVGAHELLAHALVMAARVVAAGLRRADVRLAAHERPHVRIRLHREVAQRAVVGRLRPFPDALELLGFRRGEKLARLRHRALQPRRADVVRASFPEDRAEVARHFREHLPHDRDVLENELLLQIDRVGGDDRLPVLLLRPEDRRDEIRERFPHARPRLDDEMPFLRQRLRHRDRHLLLLRPILEALRLRQQAIRGKNLPDGLRKIRRCAGVG